MTKNVGRRLKERKGKGVDKERDWVGDIKEKRERWKERERSES